MLKEFSDDFAKYKKIGQQTMAQVSDDALNHVPGADLNSIAIIVRHLNGNLISRFTDFLTTDGEKNWRDRDTEFSEVRYSRKEVEEFWAKGWEALESALAELRDEDLQKTVSIKGNLMTADAALCRALAHIAYHVGQMVLLGRVTSEGQWQYLSTRRKR
jgi:hypothetical protein